MLPFPHWPLIAGGKCRGKCAGESTEKSSRQRRCSNKTEFKVERIVFIFWNKFILQIFWFWKFRKNCRRHLLSCKRRLTGECTWMTHWRSSRRRFPCQKGGSVVRWRDVPPISCHFHVVDVFDVLKMNRDRECWIALGWVNDPAAQCRWRQPFGWITKFWKCSSHLSSAHLMRLSWVSYSSGQ